MTISSHVDIESMTDDIVVKGYHVSNNIRAIAWQLDACRMQPVDVYFQKLAQVIFDHADKGMFDGNRASKRLRRYVD